MRSHDTMFLPQAYSRLKRGPQVMLPKDIGMVMAYTGVGKNSVCVDAGTGSGWLAISLARICKSVVSYDVRPDFIRIAEQNRAAEGLDNLVFKEKDITEGIDEKEVDLVTLDMPDSDKAVRSAHRALKQNGFVFGYLPHVEQVKKFVQNKAHSEKARKAIEALNMLSPKGVLKVLEIMPKNAMLLRQILAQEKKAFTDDDVNKILAITKEKAQ